MTMKRSARVISGVILAIVTGAILFTYIDYRHDLAGARERISSGSQVADTPCGKIEYAVTGAGAPVLVLHGAGGGFDQGLAIGSGLAERGFKVIAVSRFGYLRTPLPGDASAAAQGDAYACLLDALKLPKAAIMAASAGSHSAVQFCLRHAARCSALVLLVPAIFDSRAGPMAQPPALLQHGIGWLITSDFVIWAALKLARSGALEFLFGTPAVEFRSAPPEEQERVLRIAQSIFPVSERRDGLRNDFAVITASPSYELERLAAPTLIIAAEDDRFRIYEGARAIAERIPGARFVGFPSGGHLLVGRHKAAVAEMAGFLKPRPDRKRSRSR